MSQTQVLYLTTFVANAAILVFEIAGARSLAPFLGTSVEVWAGTIAVILGGMALGYALGGIVADRYPTKKMLGIVLFASGVAALVAWGVRDMVPMLFANMHALSLTFIAMYTATLLFAPTVILLAAVSPFIAKFLITTLNSSAKTVGNINAIGTVGSIAGAIASSAFLIPSFGLDQIFLGIAIVLLCLSLVVSVSHIGVKGLAVCLVGAGALYFSLSAQPHIERASSMLADVSTLYNRTWIFEMPFEGETVRALRTDPFGTQCGMYVTADASVDEERIAFSYVRAFDMFTQDAYTPHDKFRALFLGGCNYSHPRAFLSAFPSASATVVELDPGMTELAKKFFAFAPEHFPSLSIAHEDARRFLRGNSERYDIVFMDVFGSSSNIPHHLTTTEAFSELADTLSPNGLFLMNLIGMRVGESSAFPSSLVATLEQAFPHVGLYAFDGTHEKIVQNLIIAASHTRELPETLSSKDYHLTLRRLDSSALQEGIVLTDNFAPVEYLTGSMRERVF